MCAFYSCATTGKTTPASGGGACAEMTTALTDGVILIDKRDNVEWWNQAAGHLFGFKEVDQGHKLTNIIRAPNSSTTFDQRSYQQPLELNAFRKDDLQLQIQVHPSARASAWWWPAISAGFINSNRCAKTLSPTSPTNCAPLTVIKGYLETLTDSEQMPPHLAAAHGLNEARPPA